MKEYLLISIIIKYLTRFPTSFKEGLWLRHITSDRLDRQHLSVVRGNGLDVIADLVETNRLIVWYHAKNDTLFFAADSGNSFIEPLKDGMTITHPWTMRVQGDGLVLDNPVAIPQKHYLDGLRSPSGFLLTAGLVGATIDNPQELIKKLFPEGERGATQQ